MAIELETVIKQLEESGIVAPARLKEFIPPAASPKDGEALVRELLKQGLLTKFQATQVAAGKSKALALGNYTLLDKIGAGGMGQVFKARHRRMDRLVAIKMLPPAMMKDAAAAARFEREVRAAAKLRHPNIVAADDADEANGVHFLVMEYIEGSDLSALVKERGPVSVDQGVDYITQAARGLAFAHSEGVVHRDIKPANLLLDKKGSVKILDMGLARIEDANAPDQQLTNTGTVMGTVDYMAPEQATDTRNADARSDVYSLGCSLYRILTGESAFEGDTVVKKILAHMSTPVPSLCVKCPAAPAELDRIFQKMMAKRPEDRYQNAGDLVADLERLSAPVSAEGASISGLSMTTNMPTSGTSLMPEKFVEDGMTALLGNQQLRGVYETDRTSNFVQQDAGTDPKSTINLPQINRQPPKKGQPKSASDKGPPWKSPKVLIGAGAAGFLFLLLGVIFIIRDKDGNEIARVEAPKGSSVEVKPKLTKEEELKKANEASPFKVGGGQTMPEPAKPKSSTPPSPSSSIQTKASEPYVSWPFDPPDGLEYVWSEPENLGAGVNTSDSETVSGINIKHDKIYFVRWNKAFWASRNSAGLFSGAQEIRSLSKVDHGDCWAMSANELFTAVLIASGNKREIWFSAREKPNEPNSGLTPLVRAPEPVNADNVTAHPTLSADGLTLLCASTRTGCPSGDIWMFTRTAMDQPFKTAERLPSPVNTSAWDMPCYVSNDRCFLITASQTEDAQKKSIRTVRYFTRSQPSAPFHSGLPLGIPLGAAEDAVNGGFRLTDDGRTIYFHTNTLPGGQGQSDIWLSRRVPKAGASHPSPLASHPSPAIPAEALTFGGHRYLLVDSLGTWERAKAQAEAAGGHLVTINGKEERDWLEKIVAPLVNGGSTHRVMIGGMRRADGEPWTWVTGEPFDEALWPGKRISQPNFLRLSWFKSGWDDITSQIKGKYFIVEWDVLGPAIGTSQGSAPPLAKAPFDSAQAKAHQAAWAKHLGTEVVKPNSLGMQMTLIPPGEFLMGSTDADITLALKIAAETKFDSGSVNRIQDERPQHLVRITQPFRLCAHEVTIGQFAKFVEQTKYKTQAEEFGGNSGTVKPEEVKPDSLKLNWRTPGQAVTDDSPVTQVSRNDAVAFCNWLSKQEKLEPCYQPEGDTWALLPNANGYRLPTEAEWEYACRGGTTTQYSFGDDWKEHDKYGWSNNNAGGRPRSVGLLPANPFGLYDMHGNVWEWCQDWYDVKWYGKSPSDDPLGPSKASSRLHRGGGWNDLPASSRSSYRYRISTPSSRASNRGFRPALSSVGAQSSTASVTSSAPQVVTPPPVTKPTGPTPPLAKAPFNATQAKAHQAAWAKHLGTKVETINSAGMRLTLIPPGEFLMGNTDEQVEAALKAAEEIKADQATKDRIQKAERPQHRVVITKPLLMSATEVTVGQFRKFVEAAKYITEAEQYGFGNSSDKTLSDKVKDGDKGKNWQSPGYAVTDDSPVAQVTWNDAVAYCQWLSAQEKATYRLPTEAEWEYACRAGTTTQYSFGDTYAELEQFGWYIMNAAGKSYAVGTKLPNAFGLYDMHGNLQEWCGDYYDDKWYEKSQPDDPIGPASGSNRVLRGGTWNHVASNCRSACRILNSPSTRHYHNGFRVVRVW